MRAALLLVGFLASPALALPPARAEKMVAAARAVLGKPYQLGGRLQGGEGIDCLGVVFLAAESISRCGWKSFSVYPTRLVADEELGSPVAGLSPVRSDLLEVARLEVGDVLMLVHPVENSAEKAIGKLDGVPVWVWHTGVYVGEGRWIVGDLFAGEVIETDLKGYLAQYSFAYSGVFVTRMKSAPAPARCRLHPPHHPRAPPNAPALASPAARLPR